MTKMNEYKGYDLFNDVGDFVLRTWNRYNTILNIKEEHGNALAIKYAGHLDKQEQFAILTIGRTVSARGYENVRRELFKEHINA